MRIIIESSLASAAFCEVIAPLAERAAYVYAGYRRLRYVYPSMRRLIAVYFAIKGVML